MTRSLALSALVVVAAAGSAVWYLHRDAPPACTSEPALGRVSDSLRDQFHLDSIFLNDIRTVGGSYFGDRYDCAAEVATIRGNQDVSTLPWRAVHYAVVHRGGAQQDGTPDFAVSVQLSGSTPFVRQKLSWWHSIFDSR